MIQEGGQGKGKVAGREYGLFGPIPFIREIITGKAVGKLGTTLGMGTNLQVDMTTAIWTARDAENESRDYQKRKKAFHCESANTTSFWARLPLGRI
jgi:hypothetical protein